MNILLLFLLMLHTAHTSSEVCGIHKLPTELLILIINCLWDLTPVVRTHFMSMPVLLCLVDGAKDKKALTLLGLPLWLRTSRYMNQLGMKGLKKRFESTIGPCRTWLSDGHYLKDDFTYPLTDNAMTILIDALSTSSKNIYSPGARYGLSMVGQNAIFYTLKRIRERVERWTPNTFRVPTLRLRVAFTSVCTYCQKVDRGILGFDEWSLDLRPLGDFAFDVDAFELEVTGVNTRVEKDRRVHHMSCWDDQVQEAFDAEVKRVGRALTGDSSGSCSIRITETAQSKDVIFRFRASTETERLAVELSSIAGRLRRDRRWEEAVNGMTG